MGRDAGIWFDRKYESHPLHCPCDACEAKRKDAAEVVKASRRAKIEREIKNRHEKEIICGNILIVVISCGPGIFLGEEVGGWWAGCSFPFMLLIFYRVILSTAHYERTRRSIIRRRLKRLKDLTASSAEGLMKERRA